MSDFETHFCWKHVHPFFKNLPVKFSAAVWIWSSNVQKSWHHVSWSHGYTQKCNALLLLGAASLSSWWPQTSSKEISKYEPGKANDFSVFSKQHAVFVRKQWVCGQLHKLSFSRQHSFKQSKVHVISLAFQPCSITENVNYSSFCVHHFQTLTCPSAAQLFAKAFVSLAFRVSKFLCSTQLIFYFSVGWINCFQNGLCSSDCHNISEFLPN